ncbi:MAG: DNA starvation/stationary phase protection protein [Bryobacterales bacterium]|nr:DNA starvation/stationary phase protection protein [Bryobacterales bacterium]
MGKAALTEDLSSQVSRENSPDNSVVAHLQRQVANAFLLYANYKHYHWQTYGPLFRDVHLLFDEMASDVLKTLDELAERIRMIGQDPVYLPRDLERHAGVKPGSGARSLRAMVEEAQANLLGVIKDMRAAAREADNQDDPGTVDLFSKTVQIHEKHEWFLREILKKNDGLVT